MDMDLNLTNRSATGFTIDWIDVDNGNDEPCPLANAEDVYKVTVETSIPISYVSMSWSSVTWEETTSSGPSIYANSLTSGKPSWLEEVATGGELTYSFTNDGMGFQGNADEETFPYVSTFTIPHDEKVKIEFVFGYYSRCDDQGVILYSESATPIWDWGMTQTGLIAQWNCGVPELGWPNGSTYPDGEELESVLEVGGPFKGIIDYDPSLSDSNFRLTTKTYSGQTIDSITISQLLPPGDDYKIGFSSDSDGDEGGNAPMSFFKNLKITIG
jgi:hypothetical protein